MSTERIEVGDCWLEADLVAGTGGPVLFLHGASQSRVDAKRIMEAAGVNRPLLLPDSRGHGASVEGDFTKQSWQQLTDDAVAWLDAVDARDAVVTGISMGAIIAPAVALARPDRVSSIVPMYPVFLGSDAPADPTHWAMLTILLATFSVPDADAIIGALAPAGSGIDATPMREQLGMHRNLAGVSAYFNADRTPESLPYTTADLQAMQMPVTVVGGGDPFHPPQVGRDLAALIPDARLVELVDVAPDEHEAAMARALRDHIDAL